MNVAELRKKLGITQLELATELDVASATIYRWERKGVKPHKVYLRKLEKLAKGMD